MKIALLSAAALAVLASVSLAQNAPPPVRPGPARAAALGGTGTDSEDAPRFDLKFPGGKVKEFVAAVSKALGQPVNVIVPKESEATLIPAVDVSRVTVRGLFRALSNASNREVAIPVNIQSSGSGQGRVTNTSIQYKFVNFTFSTEETNPSPDAVWTFVANDPVGLPTAEPLTQPRLVQYFPVAEYLSHFSVEDITTALESGWKLQGPAAEEPATIRFHEETKLLIISGTEAQMKLIPQVLEGLAKMLSFPRTENLAITRKAGQIILPKIEFREATPREAVDFIRRKAAELDPEHLGFNVVIDDAHGVSERRVTLSLSHIPAMEVLKLIAQLADMEHEIRDHAFVLRARELRPAPAFVPAAPESFRLPGYPAPSVPTAPPEPSAVTTPPVPISPAPSVTAPPPLPPRR